MKKHITVIILTMSSWGVFGQTSADLATMLELSINLPALQAYYPDSPIEEKESVYIIQENYPFPTNLGVMKFGKPLMFAQSDNDIAALHVASLSFSNLSFDADNASASFMFSYPNPSIKKTIEVFIGFQQVGVSWIIINHQLNLQ